MSEPITTVADLRELARRRVPRAFFEYADRGSYDELTLRDNRAALEAIRLRQRVMVDVDTRSLATTLAGQPASLPLAIAPTGLAGLQHGAGEILGARAAARAGIPFCLSTMSICSIEQVRAACPEAPFWFQVYVMRDRGFARELIQRAGAAQCPVLVLTADLTVQGQRHREIKNGLAVPPRLTLRNLLDIASKPRWAWSVLRAPGRSFGNLHGRIGGDSLTTLAQWIASQFDPTLDWDDLEWIRALWPGKLVLKGVLDPEDARIAAGHGVDAIVVSNHGGRQLDGAPASIHMLPRVAEAVDGRCEVLFDGGVTSGQSLLKALALGARGALVGKAFLYGLGAMGEAGVTRMIEIIRRELDVSMALTGQTDVHALGPDILLREDGSPWLDGRAPGIHA